MLLAQWRIWQREFDDAGEKEAAKAWGEAIKEIEIVIKETWERNP